jgi:hypothetical protein
MELLEDCSNVVLNGISEHVVNFFTPDRQEESEKGKLRVSVKVREQSFVDHADGNAKRDKNLIHLDHAGNESVPSFVVFLEKSKFVVNVRNKFICEFAMKSHGVMD